MTTKHKHWNPGTLMAQAYRDIANEHNATVDALAAAQQEIADWKAGRYRAVVLGPEHAGVRHAVMVPPITDGVIERMAEAFYQKRWANGNWDRVNSDDQSGYKDAIRAALAAIGPQYCPSDVGFASRVPGLEAELAEARAALAHIQPARPKGLPSVEELVKIGTRAALDALGPNGKCIREARAAAIRDAVLAGAMVEQLKAQISRLQREASESNTFKGMLEKRLASKSADLSIIAEVLKVPEEGIIDEIHRLKAFALKCEVDAITSATPTSEQIEALARVLLKAGTGDTEFAGGAPKEHYMTVARAAFEFMRVGPKGLPTKDEVAQVIYQLWTGNIGVLKNWDEWHNKEFFVRLSDGLIAALAPYLREPTGWEMDVEAVRVALSEFKTYADIRNYLMSRIRPTFECKECAKKDTRIEMYERQAEKQVKRNHLLERDIVKAHGVLSAARAALEGE